MGGIYSISEISVSTSSSSSVQYQHCWSGAIVSTRIVFNCIVLIIRPHRSELCKSSWTDRDGIWDVDSGGPKNHVLDGVQIPTPHHDNRFTALLLGPPGWACARRQLLDFMVQGKINRGRHTDHPAGRHSSGLTSAHLHHPPYFLQAVCPSCRSTNSVKALKGQFWGRNWVVPRHAWAYLVVGILKVK